VIDSERNQTDPRSRQADPWHAARKDSRTSWIAVAARKPATRVRIVNFRYRRARRPLRANSATPIAASQGAELLLLDGMVQEQPPELPATDWLLLTAPALFTLPPIAAG
jgi:hypothetical protein